MIICACGECFKHFSDWKEHRRKTRPVFLGTYNGELDEAINKLNYEEWYNGHRLLNNALDISELE